MNLLLDIFLIGGMLINILILLVLWKARKKGLPQRLLLFFFGIVFFYTLHAYADTHDVNLLFLSTFIFNDMVELFTGPLIYLYIKSLFEDNKDLVKRNVVHFIPVSIYVVVISIPVLVSIIKKEFVFNYLDIMNTNMTFLFLSFILYLIFYALLSLRLFYKYRRAMKFNFSNLSENDFGWVKHMLVGVVFVSCFDLFTSLYELFVGEIGVETNYLTLIVVTLLLGYLGYYGIRQSKILLPDFLIQEERVAITNSKSHALSNTSKETLDTLEKRLKEVLKIEQLYLDEELTLSKLAEKIPTTDKKLSALLNQYLHTSFYDLINTYRVADVKDKIASSNFENYTLLGMAYESGFKSKTSFNRIFKKETGLSPSAYKKSLQK